MQGAARARLRRIWLGALGVVAAVAFLSLWLQIEGLSGSNGLVPFDQVLTWIGREIPADGARGWAERLWHAPTVLWWLPLDGGLHACAAVGVVASLMAAAGVAEGPSLAVAWVCWTSLSTAGTLFLWFQWDSLLSESMFLSLFVARWRTDEEPHPAAWWLLQLLGVRLMFFAGVVKLVSGDPTWRDGTALAFHYETQPLPNPLSWWAHQAPVAVHQASVVVMFAIELLLPPLVLFGRRGRAIAFVGCATLMIVLALTGNYGFFQVLSVLVCASWLDDGHLGDATTPAAHRAGLRDLPVLAAAPLLIAAALANNAPRLGVEGLVPAGLAPLASAARQLRVANGYGLFAVMTTDRPEIEFEGTEDGHNWFPIPARYKPGPLDRRPPQVAPHQPRLDWQLWFAALSTCDDNPWVRTLMRRMLESAGPATRLLHPDAALRRPIAVRANLWSYRFTRYDGEIAPAAYWTRTWIGPYCPVVRSSPEPR